MLKRLFIQNFVLIDSLDLDFEKGLSVVTGETGAGKSILLDAISLGLGNRADLSMIRPGSERAQIILEFDLPLSHPVYHNNDAFLHAEDGFFIKRILTKSGHNKAYINDQPVTLATLKEVGVNLIEIIGQFSTASLMEKSEHLLFLDSFGKLQGDVDEVRHSFSAWSSIQKQLRDIQEEKECIERDYDYLSSILKELDELAPQENEESALIDQKSQFSQAQKLYELIEKTILRLNEPRNLSLCLYAAQRELMKAPVQAESIIAPIYQQLEKAAFEVEDAEAKLRDLLDKTSKEAQAVEVIDDRIFALRHLARKHRTQPDDLAAFWKATKDKIDAFVKAESCVSGLLIAEQDAFKAYKIVAEKLSQKRQKSAILLEDQIHQELHQLKLEKALFKVLLKAEAGLYATGTDQVCFTFAPNPGLPFTPIDETASGGEMSRLLLALKILDQSDTRQTLIFDEIDTGVGGAVSDALGIRLQKLSKSTQIIAITHAPQIAAKADQHYKVEKKTLKDQTSSNVVLLSDKAHEEEIARMLSGAIITEEARRAAQSLLTSKYAFRKTASS